MSTPQTFAIAGASLAGAKAAQTLREEGFDGRVVLIGAEDERPYERPPLSKDYLRGESQRDKVYVHEAGFYEDNDIELRTGAASTSRSSSRWTCRSSARSARSSARSTATSTATTAPSCCSARAWRPSRAVAPSSACAPTTAERSTAASWSSASASSRAP